MTVIRIAKIGVEMKNSVGVDLDVYTKIAEKVRTRIPVQPIAEEHGEE